MTTGDHLPFFIVFIVHVNPLRSNVLRTIVCSGIPYDVMCRIPILVLYK